MTDNRGYLLPSGDAYTDELACVLLFYPDKDEYRRALRGALDYFAVWLAWERDSAKRGQDAARAWKEANEYTYECMDMNYCALILANLDAIVNLLSQQHCCDGNNTVTYNDNTIVTTTIVPGVGDPPATWGEEEVPADWDEWAEYVCYHAHLYVDNLIEGAAILDTMVTVGSWGIDFLSFWLSKMIYGSPAGIPVPVNFGWVNMVSNKILDALGTLEFDTLATKFEDARDDIVCSLINGTSLEDAVEDAVDSTVLWNVFYTWLDYDSTVATIYTGEVPGHGYLTPDMRSDCTCIPGDYYLERLFTSGKEAPWVGENNWSAGYGGSLQMIQSAHEVQASKVDINTAIGVGGTGNRTLHRIDWTWRRSTANSVPRLTIRADGGDYVFQWPSGDTSFSTLYEKSVTFDPPKVLSVGNGDLIKFHYAAYNNYVNIGEIILWLD